MASLLPTEIASTVANALRGVLMAGTLRREVAVGVDSKGDPSPASSTSYTVEGLRENFSAFYASVNGIPHTDVKIMLVLGLIVPATVPIKNDQIYIRSEWYKVRRIVELDPASATIVLQCFKIDDPS